VQQWSGVTLEQKKFWGQAWVDLDAGSEAINTIEAGPQGCRAGGSE